ncbi:MAG: sigma-70 family RNA polymerase sigma factor [Alphaproteobacteria bacterium]|nr:sigma-70 family RNA polymerase sigma factor [Alphaproteobacteria bacterium]
MQEGTTQRAAADALGDSALAEAIGRGDGAAYEALVRRHGGAMLAVARRLLRDEDEARDCLQEAFLQAWTKIDTFEGRSALGTWLHRIVVNAALMRLRKRKRRAEESIDALLPEFDADGCRIEPAWQMDEPADSLVQRAQVRELVLQSIDRLPDDYRTVLILRDIEGYDTAEVAQMTGDSQGAIKTRLHRARAALKKLLEPIYGGELT